VAAPKIAQKLTLQKRDRRVNSGSGFLLNKLLFIAGK
jgi:hypothetical protein